MISSVLNFSMVKSQTNQGKILLGVSSFMSFTGNGSNLMSFGFTSSKTKSDQVGFIESDPDKTFSFNLSPKIGYFITNNLAFGLDITTGYSKNENKSTYYDNTSSGTMICVGPFARYYISAGKVSPFFEVGGTLGRFNSKFTDTYMGNTTTSESKSNILGIGGGVGIAAPLGERVTFDVVLDYNTFTVKAKNDNPNNTREIDNTFGLKLGFVVLLGGN